jgi:hypothetical protein
MLAAITLRNYHRGSWRLATHGRLLSLRAAGTALKTQISSMNYYCDMYLRIMRSHLRGRAELRHYRIAPTGRLPSAQPVFMRPNQSLTHTSTTSSRSWCSPREINASTLSHAPRYLRHPWSMLSTVSTTDGAIRAFAQEAKSEKSSGGREWAGWAGAILGACGGSGRAAGNRYAALLPSPVTFTSQSLLQRCCF